MRAFRIAALLLVAACVSPAMDSDLSLYDRFVLTADIPGVDPADIEITMEQGVLTLKGERTLETQEEDKGYKRVERAHGAFYRRFSLPDTADPEQITASGKNGVLEITIPKKEQEKPRRISVAA